MWISIVAWVVTVMSCLVSLTVELPFPSLRRQFVLWVDSGEICFGATYDYGPGEPPMIPIGPVVDVEFEPALPSWRMLLPDAWVADAGVAGGLSLRSTVASVPIWPLAFLPTVAFSILHRRDRRLAHRLKHNLCTRCGYSRAGIAEGAPCPECGEGSESASKTSPE